MSARRNPSHRAADAPRNGALARIHILKKDCRLSEDEYRDLIGTLTNGRVRSSRDCDHTERERLIAHLTLLDRRLNPGLAAKPRRARTALNGQQKKVYAIWKTLETAGVVRNGEYRSLRAFVERQTGLSALEFCDGGDCSKLIESLKAWAKRTNVELD